MRLKLLMRAKVGVQILDIKMGRKRGSCLIVLQLDLLPALCRWNALYGLQEWAV